MIKLMFTIIIIKLHDFNKHNSSKLVRNAFSVWTIETRNFQLAFVNHKMLISSVYASW